MHAVLWMSSCDHRIIRKEFPWIPEVTFRRRRESRSDLGKYVKGNVLRVIPIKARSTLSLAREKAKSS